MDIWGILEYTASVTVIGLLIWGMKLLFYDKLDARWHYFIWLVLLVRVIVPVRFRPVPTPLSVFQELPIGEWVEMGRIVAEKRGHGGLSGLLGWAYLWGAGLLGAFYLGLWTVLRVQVALAPRADGAAREYVEGIAGKYGLKGCRDIRVRRTGTPYVCGLVHPVLVLSGDAGLPEEQVVLHELLHREYRDVLVNIAVHAVRVVNWFNPFVWFLTAVVLNDSEALCDQRVLERCGEDSARAYGALLIAMGEGQKRNPGRIGTSNMAGSYRNMKTRIRRIRDFRRVPGKIGVATLCITLMLSVSAIGSAAEDTEGFEVPEIHSEKDLERALLYARCYHAHTPQEAIWIFLRSCEEENMAYRMAVMPEAEISGYEDFAVKRLLGQDTEACPAYFPKKPGPVKDYRVYNLVHDETTGSATVCATFPEREGWAQWRLELICEDGWKVWLTEESRAAKGEYAPEPLLEGSGRLGAFRIEVSAYKEGVFRGMDGGGFFLYRSDQAQEGWPRYFSMEYKWRRVQVSYLGEESLEGRRVKILTQDPDREGEETAGHSVTGQDSQGNSCSMFDGQELMGGAPREVYGCGNGYSQPGYCWKEGDRVGVSVQIYIDGELIEEGEVWSGEL